MALKNYSTGISASKSIAEIQANLAAHGAHAIMVNYGYDREPESLAFIIPVPGGDIPFRLPASVLAVKKVLKNQKDGSHKKGKPSDVAWRIIKDWVAAQLAIIETEMVTIEQVFLPYMVVKDDKTLFEAMKERNFYLTDGKVQNGKH